MTKRTDMPWLDREILDHLRSCGQLVALDADALAVEFGTEPRHIAKALNRLWAAGKLAISADNTRITVPDRYRRKTEKVRIDRNITDR